jgi:hypothetical protein
VSESLGDKQRRFALRISEWLAWVYQQGFSVTFGEAYRTPEQAAQNARTGRGIANSLHTRRLAIDVNLFRRNDRDQWEWLADGSAPEWQLVGKHWENMGADHAWGGRFSKPDANHLSITHDGVK